MWLYNGEPFDELLASGYEGFVYLIIDDKGRKYIGKKAFSHRNKVALSKKARVGTRKRVEIRQKDSGWRDYLGSCKELTEYASTADISKFKKEILKLCKDKSSLSYWEMVYLVNENVLFSDNYYNKNISGRFFKGKIHD